MLLELYSQPTLVCAELPEMFVPSPNDGRTSAPVVSTTPHPAMAELEMVRFEVQGSPRVLHTPPGLRNITVARGTRETLPLHLFTDNVIPADDQVVDFAHAVCRNAAPPALNASPPRHRSRPQQQEFTIRRSERLANKSRHRATKPAVQAQNVMMKKLGITSDSQPPDASSFQQYTATF